MSAHDNLSPQQFTPDQVDVLRSSDFPGSIGDNAARARFKRYNESESWRSSHREAGGALPYLDHFIDRVRQDGHIKEPVVVEERADGDHYAIHDGHHRAMAAHALRLPLPYRVRKDDD